MPQRLCRRRHAGLLSAGAGAWTTWSSLAIILTMVIMTVSGWMLLEAFKPYALTASFNLGDQDLLWSQHQCLQQPDRLFRGAASCCTPISPPRPDPERPAGIGSQLASVLFVLVFSWFVWHSTRAVDRISVVLIVFMVLELRVRGLRPGQQDRHRHAVQHCRRGAGAGPHALAMLPVALTSFGYHHLGGVDARLLRRGAEGEAGYIGGTLIALALYLLWLLSIFGNLPCSAFGPCHRQGGDVDVLLGALASVIESRQVSKAINLFSMAAILSSFIGVGLGYSTIWRICSVRQQPPGRTKSWAVTFLPPLVLSPAVPVRLRGGHRLRRGAATVWACIIPALLAKSPELAPTRAGFKAPGGQPMIWWRSSSSGVLTAVFHLMAMAGMLPI